MRETSIWKKCMTAFLSLAVLCTTALTSCKKEVKYTAEPEKYLFGVAELTYETMPSAVDSGVTSDWVATKIGELGAKTVRVWMHHENILYRAEKSNELYINEAVAEKYHDYIGKLKSAGVERILAMNHAFVHPYGYTGDSMSVPDPYEEADTYLEFLKMFKEGYRLIAKEFPEIGYFETGNEWDYDGVGMYFHKTGWSSDKPEYAYSPTQAGMMAADLCWYANRGVKESNPNAIIVSPGTTHYETGVTFLDSMYTSIKEGRHPTGEKYADKNADNYFQIVAWHPYLDPAIEPPIEDEEAIDEWFEFNKQWHDVMVKHGDGDKTMWATEFGFSDQRYPNNLGVNGQEQIANRMRLIVSRLPKKMPWVETVILFRLATCEEHLINDYENGFGLFYSPNHADEAKRSTPKPIAKFLYEYFNEKKVTETTFSK